MWQKIMPKTTKRTLAKSDNCTIITVLQQYNTGENNMRVLILAIAFSISVIIPALAVGAAGTDKGYNPPVRCQWVGQVWTCQ
jgi:hypothetical protein